jgi:hypothetical protein
MGEPDAMFTLEEAMRKLADLSVNGRSWAQCLAFLQLKGTVRRATDWTDDEFFAQLEKAKGAR